MTPPEEYQWFADHLQPHEPAVRAYLASRFPWLRELDDVVQESYARVLKAHRNGPIRHARAFFFSTAHNTAVDLFRRKARQPFIETTELRNLPVPEDIPGVGEQMDEQLLLAILEDALNDLPARCRQVVLLRFRENLSYKEIAARLGVTTDTVKVQLSRGVRRCSHYLVARNLIRGASGQNKAVS